MQIGKNGDCLMQLMMNSKYQLLTEVTDFWRLVPLMTLKDISNVYSIAESSLPDLTDVITRRKFLSTLNDVEKYQYLTKALSP